MDIYEQLVEFYLTVIERCAVIPQFPVLFDREGNPVIEGEKLSWASFPDFLALNFMKHQVQVIEVSKNVSPQKAHELIRKLLDNRTHIETYVRWLTSDDFGICWRYFVRKEKVASILRAELEKLSSKGINSQVIELEEVFNQIRDKMP